MTTSTGATEVNGQPEAGRSSGEALDAMQEVARQVLPGSFGSSWTGISDEQQRSGRQTMIIFLLAIAFVYLLLAALYESFYLPMVILLSVPLAVLGGLSLQALRGLPNDVFCQIGIVMLVGLASKNAILIIEFAEQLRRQGRDLTEAAIEAARLRLRPILMTSIAFLLGTVPLLLASGAGRRGPQVPGHHRLWRHAGLDGDQPRLSTDAYVADWRARARVSATNRRWRNRSRTPPPRVQPTPSRCDGQRWRSWWRQGSTLGAAWKH